MPTSSEGRVFGLVVLFACASGPAGESPHSSSTTNGASLNSTATGPTPRSTSKTRRIERPDVTRQHRDDQACLAKGDVVLRVPNGLTWGDRALDLPELRAFACWPDGRLATLAGVGFSSRLQLHDGEKEPLAFDIAITQKSPRLLPEPDGVHFWIASGKQASRYDQTDLKGRLIPRRTVELHPDTHDLLALDDGLLVAVADRLTRLDAKGVPQPIEIESSGPIERLARADLTSFWLLNFDGVLRRVGLDGTVHASAKLPGKGVALAADKHGAVAVSASWRSTRRDGWEVHLFDAAGKAGTVTPGPDGIAGRTLLIGDDWVAYGGSPELHRMPR